MSDYRTNPSQAPHNTNIYTERERSGGVGMILFVLGAVVAIVAVLWYTIGAPKFSSAPNAPAAVVQEEGDVNLTIESPAEQPAPEAVTPEAAPAPAAPAPAQN